MRLDPTLRLLALSLCLSTPACTGAADSLSSGGPQCHAPRGDFTTTWAQNFAGDLQSPGTDEVWAVATDREGDLLVGGSYGGNLQLGDGTLPGDGKVNGFVVAYAPSGARLWSVRLPARVFQVEASPNGGVVVAGAFQGEADFGGGPVQGGAGSMFLVRLDSSGHYVWSRVLGGGGSPSDYVNAGALVDPFGRIDVAGAFTGSVDLGYGPSAASGGPDKRDAFVAQYDDDGTPRWVRVFGDADGVPASDQAFGLGGVDGVGNMVIGALNENALDVGGAVLPSGTSVLALDPSGAYRWHYALPKTTDPARSLVLTSALSVDPAGNVVFGGSFYGTVDFGDGPLQAAFEEYGEDPDAFLVRLDARGGLAWSKRIPLSYTSAPGNEELRAIVAGPCGITIAGQANGVIDFGGGPLGDDGGTPDVFVAELDTNGHHLHSAAYPDGSMQALAVSNDRILLGGHYVGELALPGAPLGSGGAWDGFAAILRP